MSNQKTIDDSTYWSQPIADGQADNVHIVLVGQEPHLQLIKYEKVTGNHVDVASVVVDLNLNSIDNLEHLGNVIKEKLWQFKNPES